MGQNTQYHSTAVVAAESDFLRHELANVLHGLAGMTRLLKSSHGDADRKHWCEAIEQAARQACSLLLDGGGSAAPEIRRIDGPSLLEAVVRAHTPAATNKGLKLALVTAAGMGRHWRTDAALLRQVLDNLLVNAVKFSGQGIVALIARPGPAGRLFLHVVDQGPGVLPGDRQRIFRPGQRGQSHSGLPGTGLGLALCRRNVSLLGGHIRCTGIRNGGSCFSVALPAALQGEDRFELRPPALATIRYRLEIEPPTEGVLRLMLDSFGIEEDSRDQGPLPDTESGLVVTVREAGNALASERCELVLCADAPGVEPVRLAAPLLPSRVRRGLIQLALAWRWSAVSRGAGTG
jgi:anti-sigma regulatory factor (Ser/Thr protein kinase)